MIHDDFTKSDAELAIEERDRKIARDVAIEVVCETCRKLGIATTEDEISRLMDEPRSIVVVANQDIADRLNRTHGDWVRYIVADDGAGSGDYEADDDDFDDDECRLDGIDAMGALSFRSFQCRASSIDSESRTVDATITTESRVPMPDSSRMEMVDEVLLTSGAEFPPSRQVPLLDSHNRKSIDDQLGSVRDLAIDGDRTSGTLHFSSTADDAWGMVEDGHVTDISAGYRAIQKQYIPRGEKKTIAGKEYDGPVNIVTKWRLYEASLTSVGADQQAKLRGLDSAAA